MIRRAAYVICLFLAAPAFAKSPQFGAGAVYVGLQWGGGAWRVDNAHLASQIGPAAAAIFTGDLTSTHTLALRIGYTIRGHVSLEAMLTGTGWNLASQSRGGGGFGVGLIRWHPLELLWLSKHNRPIPLDVSPSFGVGWGLVGQRFSADGVVLQVGGDAEYYFNRYFGVGLFVKCVFPQWSSVYLDYSQKTAPGMTLTAPRGIGGAFWHLGIQTLVRFGD